MKKTMSGFTIVELLVVIVVIAIVAAISTVAYAGIQERAQNTKTIAAVRQWAQILKMYKADAGAYPTMISCLGAGYGKGLSGNESSGGECREDTAGSGLVVQPSFTTLMNNYIQGPTPTPSFVRASSSDYPWYRGSYFYIGYTGSKDRIDFVLAGSGTTCPAIGDLTMSRTSFSATNSVLCRAFFPDSPF